MTDVSTMIDGLKAHLRELSLQTRCTLLTQIETSRLRGDSEPAHRLIVEALRAILQEEHISAQRIGTPMRIFCEPLEPFLVDEAGTGKHRGFICRRSLNLVWRWISGDAAAARFTEAETEATEALVSGDYERAREIARGIRAEALPLVERAISQAARDDRFRRQLSMELEGRGYEDLKDIAAVLRLETPLARLGDSLPARIDDLSPDMVSMLLAQLDFETEDLVYPLILVFRRLTNASQILQILVRAEQTDDGARLARSRFATCADIVLSDIDFAVERMARHVGRPNEFEALVAAIHRYYALASGFGVAIDLNGGSQWRSQVADLRRRACEIVTTEVTRIPGTVRRALKPRREAGQPLVTPDAADVADAELAARLMVALRPYRSELAVNELLTGVVRQMENFIEAVNTGVLQDLRTARGSEKAAARARFETAVSLNRIVFGDDYAALVQRSGMLADPPSETAAAQRGQAAVA